MIPLTAVRIRVTVFDDPTAGTSYYSYTLPTTPFYLKTFWIDSTQQAKYSQYDIIWDLGDGTIKRGLSALHYYKAPGIYNVTATFIDGNGNSAFSSQSVDLTTVSLTAYNAVPDILVLNSFTDSITAAYLLPAGKQSKPVTLRQYNSWQSVNNKGSTVYLYASGSKSDFLSLSSYYTNKWAHLRAYFGFLETSLNSAGALTTKYVDRVTLTNTVSVFAEKYQIPYTWDVGLNFYSYKKENTVFAGISSTNDSNRILRFVDQRVIPPVSSSEIIIFAQPDSTQYSDSFIINNNLYPYVQYPLYGVLNVPYKAQKIYSTYNSPESIIISSNGITVEGDLQNKGPLSAQLINAFSIYPVKWTKTEIPFVITLKDSENYTTKCLGPISGFNKTTSLPTLNNTVNISLHQYIDTGTSTISTKEVSNYTIIQNPTAPQLINSGGYFCGSLYVPSETRYAVLCASALITTLTGTKTIFGTSNLFDIIDRSPIINKINENYDQTATYKSYILQESLFDNPILLDSFIGQIVGNINSLPETLGKTVYEKIANFVSNRSDPDACNLDALDSLFEQYGLSLNKFVTKYPAGLKRVMDLLSINQRYLFGTPNKFNRNFGLSAYGYELGKNLGEEISIATGTFIVGEPIVAYEKFSEIYTLINQTLIPTTAGIVPISGQPYSLSGINYDWGWGLITGNRSQSGTELSDYYKFYRYKNYTPETPLDNIIDFDNEQTTITQTESGYFDWIKYGGTMDKVISRALYEGFKLYK